MEYRRAYRGYRYFAHLFIYRDRDDRRYDCGQEQHYFEKSVPDEFSVNEVRRKEYQRRHQLHDEKRKERILYDVEEYRLTDKIFPDEPEVIKPRPFVPFVGIPLESHQYGIEIDADIEYSKLYQRQ